MSYKERILEIEEQLLLLSLEKQKLEKQMLRDEAIPIGSKVLVTHRRGDKLIVGTAYVSYRQVYRGVIKYQFNKQKNGKMSLERYTTGTVISIDVIEVNTPETRVL